MSLVTHTQDKIIMYNFGSPRVGNLAFVNQYNKCVPESFRIVNDAGIYLCVCMYVWICVYVYVYIYKYKYVYIYNNVYTWVNI